jgi:catechol 2,3-dioxygenase-like lactoylglutathione lyase family enzyme
MKEQVGNHPFTAIDHVQLAMPPGEEATARRFFGELLGMEEIPKPTELAKRGGCWFQSGAVQVHIGVDHNFHPATKAHPALRCRDYASLLARLQEADIAVQSDVELPGVTRCHILDPWGNRIELIGTHLPV